jgi:hypothetical protein
MSHRYPNEFRERVAAQLDRLQELTVRRNWLLARAASDPRPAVAHALRVNRRTAEAIRRSLRLARAQCFRTENSGQVARPPE